MQRRLLKVRDSKVFDTETIYVIAISILNTTTVLVHELVPSPTSMFDTDGQMRETKTKSNLKNSTKAEKSSRPLEKVIDMTFLDGFFG